MKAKVTILFFATILTQLFMACCDCPDTNEIQYKFEYATAYNLDNSGEFPVVSESPILKNAYGIRLQIGLRQVSVQDRKHFSLFNQAYAVCCICGPDTIISPRDTITSLTVTTTARFDNGHAEGSDVTDMFKVLKYNKYIDVDSVVANPAFYHKRTETTFLEMYLLTPPDQPGQHSFQVDIALSNNTHLFATTKPIELK
ncbi:MAG: hypothetical protein BGO21_21855 [Dyadobacter sp. 50-39]|uniref:DUF5034 domain-containing protein n=1 Tax=Dyadobacter sp. 50-39 TaxID=1895756 RepID=UPI00095A3CD8|nr:DUF5034 domain-containing protein [Dyadobacter sp. 50-39]OJV19710.1 MAG: hypothetical protein BGO21_21855 [Dyadobacter sp. 50-39]